MAQPETLCFLPGLLCDAALWRHQMAALEGRFACRFVDLSGHDSMAGMAARVIESTPNQFALAGFSMGGYVAFEILRQAPERVSRLALVDTRASPDSPETREARRALLDLATHEDFAAVTETLLPAYVHESRPADGALTGEIHAMAERLGPAVFRRQMAAIMGRPDSRPLLPKIACPTLLICGRQDRRTTLSDHEEMATGIPGAEMVVLEDCGHFAPLERPDDVTVALRAWLTLDGM